MAVTPNCRLVESAVLAAFPSARFGKYNCRHIGSNPLRPWSQHAGSEPDRKYFSNALDIWHVDHKPPGKPADSSPAHQAWLREVRAFITATFGPLIDQMLGPGDNAAHANHVHVSTWPKLKSNWWYKPPCKGGDLIVVFADGSEGDTFDVPIMEDEMQSNLAALRAQTMEWYVNLEAVTGHPGGIPQYWGSDYDGSLTNGVTPSDQEWLDAYDELWTAHVTASVSVGRKGDKGDKGDPTGPHGHDDRYSTLTHTHPVPDTGPAE